jgi:hypothetical protein
MKKNCFYNKIEFAVTTSFTGREGQQAEPS